eukprot:4835907-Prymnesium_polylepis.1
MSSTTTLTGLRPRRDDARLVRPRVWPGLLRSNHFHAKELIEPVVHAIGGAALGLEVRNAHL